MIARLRAFVRRHWPRLRLRTILLLTLIFVASLPGFGALFLRVYENTLVRQTEAELIAQGAAVAAAAATYWPGGVPPTASQYRAELPTIDLSTSPILPERPRPRIMPGQADGAALTMAARLRPVIFATTRTTLASIILLDSRGRQLVGPSVGLSFAHVPEVAQALHGRAVTVLRRNGRYTPTYALEWLSRASDIRIHHVRPVVANGRIVGVLMLSRSPRALFRGIYEDRGKIALGVGLILVTLIVLSGLISRGIARPIEALSGATRDVARGGGTVPDPPATAAVEIRALYEDFAVMASAIDRRSRYLRDFAHAVSHEFKTPLAGIAGAIELLEDHHDSMSDEERKRFLANVGTDAERLAQLVTRLLELARADMAEADTDARADLLLSLRRIADAWAGPDFAVTLDLPARIPPVAMPAAMIEAAVGGLVENSRQARASRVTMSARIVTDEVVLTVSDDGPGIPAADHDRVFEPFFTSRRANGGTGLGLPITRSLLASHHGSIDLAENGQGAMFVLRLPIAQRQDG
jgi:signal transduction histidine kinase